MGATYGTVGTQASKQSSDHLMRDQESRKRLRENTLFSEIAGTSAFGHKSTFVKGFHLLSQTIFE